MANEAPTSNIPASPKKGGVGLLFGRVLVFVGMSVVVVCLVLCIALVVPGLFGVKPYIVLTGSMEPSIPTGSLVYVDESANPASFVEGDVVTFHDSGASESAEATAGAVVTHRVSQNDVQNKQLVTKGDANTSEDLHPIKYGYVIGKVMFSVPVLGKLSGALSSWMGKAFVVVLVIGGLVLSLVGDQIIRASKKRTSVS